MQLVATGTIENNVMVMRSAFHAKVQMITRNLKPVKAYPIPKRPDGHSTDANNINRSKVINLFKLNSEEYEEIIS